MATYRLRRFSKPSTLRSVSPARLVKFLEPFRAFLSERGLTLPARSVVPAIDYDALAQVFMTPGRDTPSDLIDALCLVDEVSTPQGMNTLLEAIVEHGHELDDSDDQTPEDLAIEVFLCDRELLERKHAEQYLHRVQTFEYFQSCQMLPEFQMPDEVAIGQMEYELDEWFISKKRGGNSKLIIFPSEHDVAFLVRHGQPYRREESAAGTCTSSVCYRPITYDVVVFDKRLHELRIHASLVGEKKLYCLQFGRHLFGNDLCFPDIQKYTLEPLREYGIDSLCCGDIDGIESITLREFEVYWGGAYHARDTRKADDVFADLATQGESLPEGGRLTKGVFRMLFRDSPKPRNVTLRPPNVVRYTRESDARLVDEWLCLRGFVEREEVPNDGKVMPALART